MQNAIRLAGWRFLLRLSHPAGGTPADFQKGEMY
jgi:hypothetical protein